MRWLLWRTALSCTTPPATCCLAALRRPPRQPLPTCRRPPTPQPPSYPRQLLCITSLQRPSLHPISLSLALWSLGSISITQGDFHHSGTRYIWLHFVTFWGTFSTWSFFLGGQAWSAACRWWGQIGNFKFSATCYHCVCHSWSNIKSAVKFNFYFLVAS